MNRQEIEKALKRLSTHTQLHPALCRDTEIIMANQHRILHWIAEQIAPESAEIARLRQIMADVWADGAIRDRLDYLEDELFPSREDRQTRDALRALKAEAAKEKCNV